MGEHGDRMVRVIEILVIFYLYSVVYDADHLDRRIFSGATVFLGSERRIWRRE